MSDKKIIIVVFGYLSTKRGSSTDNFHYNIAKYFFDKGVLEKVYCIDYDNGVEIPDLYIESLNKYFLVKFIYKLSQYINLIFRNFPQRLIKEYIFDIFVSKRIKKGSAYLLLNLKAVVPHVIKKSKELNLYVFTLATIAHPNFNCNVVKKIQQKYNLPDRCIYTNKTRVKRVSDTFKDSDKVVLLVRSKFVFNTYVSNGIHEQDLIMLENSIGIDTKIFVPNKKNKKPREVIFMTLGHLNLIKGIPLLLQAWRELNETDNIDGRLVIAGRMDSDVKRIVKEYHKNTKKIEFTGFVESTLDTYNNADVFIASSVSDSGPGTVMEAMACGLPVIISSHCGFAEYIDEGKDGFIYDPFDIARLKMLIKWFIENKSRIPQMGKNAREKAVSLKPVDFLKYLFNACSSYSANI